MAELILSNVNKHGVSVGTLSENYATSHKIVLRGQQSKAGGMCLASINGMTLNPSNTKGLNVINISATGQVLSSATFDFSVVGHDANFITWVNGKTQGLVLMLSHTSNRSTTNLDNWMTGASNKIWSNYWRTGTEFEFSSFVGVYDCALKKFTAKQFMPPLADSKPAEISIVIDAIANNGVTGYGDPIVFDNTETIAVKTSTHDYKQWTNKQNLSDFNVKPGENLHVSIESWKDDLSFSAGEYNTFILNMYTSDERWVAGFDFNDNTLGANEWAKFSRDILVPATAAKISIYARQDPQNVGTKLGSVGTRNVVVNTSRVVPTGNTDIQTFKTANVSEVSGTNPIASTGEPNLNVLNVNSLNARYYPSFVSGYITTPVWENTQNFEFNQDIIWEYSNKTIMKSGGVEINHGLDKSNVLNYKHVFTYGTDVSTYNVENLTYSDAFNYRTVVTPTTIKHYVNNVLLGTKSITNHPTVLNLEIGASSGVLIDGTVLGMSIIDQEHNSRIYELQRTSIPIQNTISGRSQIAKTPIVEITSGGTGKTISTSVSSPAFACGLSNGDTVYATVKSFGTATGASGIVLETRYECLVINDLLSHPTAGVNWTASGNTSEMIIVCEYTPNPDINGVFENPSWIENKPFTFNTAFRPPEWKVGNDDVGIVCFKFMMTNGGGVLIDGSNVSTISSRVEINSNLSLKATGCKILMVDDKPYTNGVLSKNVSYCAIVEIEPNKIVNMIGSKFDNTSVLEGNIWDIDFRSSQKINPSYSNKFNSIQPMTLYGVPAYNTGYQCYSNFSTTDWITENAVLIPRYSFKSVAAGDFSIKKAVGLTSRCRIEFDIVAPAGKSCQILVNNAVLRTLGSSGRYVGSVSGSAIGELRIKIVGAVANSVVTVNRLDVFTDVLDATSALSSGNAMDRTFTEIERINDKRWLPVMTSNRLNFNWNTQGYFYIALDLKLQSGYKPILGGHTSRSLEMELRDNKLRLFTMIGGVSSTVIEVPYPSNLNNTVAKITACSFVKDSGLPTKRNVISLKVNNIETIVDNWNGVVNSAVNFLGYSGIQSTYGGLDVYRYQLSNMTSDMNYKSTNVFSPLIYNVIAPTLTFLKKKGVSLFKLYMLGTQGNIGWKYNVDPKLEIGRLRDSHFINETKLIRVGQSNTSGYSMDLEFENGVTPFDEIEVTLQDVTVDGQRGYDAGTFIAQKNNKAYRVLKNSIVDSWFDSSSTKSFECTENGVSTRAIFQNTPTWKEI